MIGGAGNDIYVVDSPADIVTEAANAGTDEVQTVLASYSLAAIANVENLVGTAASGQSLNGNTLDNLIVGDIGNDTLDGGAGNDTLIGGLGNDTMTGGVGDDIYFVDSLGDIVTEAANAGIDTVQTLLASYSLAAIANVENLTGMAVTGQILTGNALANTITGGVGPDTLDGGAGDDTMIGGAGNDTYIVDSLGDTVTEAANAGTDEVQTALASYSLSAIIDVENLTGTAATGQTLTGNSLANAITGGIGNDTLDGGVGIDTLVGGAGNDIYVVDSLGDTVTEAANAGTDEVQTALASYSLAAIANVENLTGTAATGQTLTGNSLANTLTGGIGNDTLDGGAGADVLTGGLGNDTYVVDSILDTVTENANEGIDTVDATTHYRLGANLENLMLLGGADLQGYGNGLANALSGNAGNNLLDGGVGADTMAGGAGNDVYVVDDAGDTVFENAGEGTDAVFATVDYTLTANVEALVLQGGADLQGFGNGLVNALYGNAGNNQLDGGAGADAMTGGAGNDSYVVDNAADAVFENSGEGNDTVSASAHFRLSANVENLTLTGSADLQGYGNGDANTLTGNSGANLLDGGAGADTMAGGTGNDVYFVDDAGDSVVENPGEGTDAVFATIDYTLTANVEALVLQGSGDLQGFGNGLVNALYGNAGNNQLDGGAGADAMFGGVGNDVFFVDDASDAVFENSGEGNDTVFASAHFRLSANVENLTLTGSADLQGYGNADANTLTGNTGNNLLDGRAGADTMAGGAGNDVYFVDDVGDTVIEDANEGTDAVFATVNFTLSANVETLVLQGAGNLSGTGNALDNKLFGNAGDNTLDGGAGADRLTGGAGNDTFVFNALQANGDTIVDFAGNGAGVGDSLSFVGFGTAGDGATFTQIGATNQWVIHSGLDAHDETITLSNSATVHPTDFLFS